MKCFLILVKNRLCVIEFGCPDINFVQSFTHLDKKIKSELQILIAVRVGYFWHICEEKRERKDSTRPRSLIK